MTKLTYTQEQFVAAAEKATEVLFQPSWKNGTGYLDGIAYAMEFNAPDGDPLYIAPGERFTTVDDFGRRVVGIVIRKGHNLVIFERYAPNTEDGTRSNVLVHNTSHLVKKAIGVADGAVKAYDVGLVGESEYINAYGAFNAVLKAVNKLAAI